MFSSHSHQRAFFIIVVIDVLREVCCLFLSLFFNLGVYDVLLQIPRIHFFFQRSSAQRFGLSMVALRLLLLP